MGCKHFSCIGKSTVPSDEEDLEVINMEESKERQQDSSIHFESEEIEKFRL